MRGAFVLQKFQGAAAALAGAVLRPLPQLLLLALLVIASWRTAGWIWQLWPLPEPAAAFSERGDQMSSALGRHWFGIAAPATLKTAIAADPIRPAAEAVKLLGVIAGGPRPAALLRIDSTNFEALLGEEFADGWRLRAIEPDAVLLVHDGREMRIVMAPPVPAAQAKKP
jgi:hypothetical protein